MKRAIQPIKKYFVVLLVVLGCMLLADTALANENTKQVLQQTEKTSLTEETDATAAGKATITEAHAVDNRATTPDSTAACAAIPAKKGVTFNFGSDLVSSYIWRGFYNAGVSIQPTLALKAGGFALTAWGSVDFTSSGYKEADLTASYSVAGFTFSLTDYYWTGSSDHSIPSRNYFRFGADTPHRIEVGGTYCFGERFPLSVAWYTMLFGADKDADGKQCYSTYAEVSYPFSVKGVDLNTWVGLTPWETPGTYGTTEFAVCNVGIGATKAIRFSDTFSLPIFTRLMWNPAMDDVHFVGGISVML